MLEEQTNPPTGGQQQTTQNPKAQTSKKTAAQPTPPKKKGCCTCLNCFLSCVIVFIVLIIGSATAMAASGLYNIPLLSSWFYKEPTVREIKPLTDKDLTKKLETLGINEKNISTKKIIDIEFTQDEAAGYLIGLTQGSGTISNTQFGIVEKANLNVKPQEIEAIILIENPLSILPLAKDKIWIDSKFFPQVQNSTLSLGIDKVKVGNLSFPLKIADAIFHYSDQLKAVPVMGLKSLELKNGSFKATLDTSNME